MCHGWVRFSDSNQLITPSTNRQHPKVKHANRTKPYLAHLLSTSCEESHTATWPKTWLHTLHTTLCASCFKWACWQLGYCHLRVERPWRGPESLARQGANVLFSLFSLRSGSQSKVPSSRTTLPCLQAVGLFRVRGAKILGHTVQGATRGHHWGVRALESGRKQGDAKHLKQ